MTEQFTATGTFEDQLQDARSIETANGVVEYVELKPEVPESDVPVMLIAGFGTDMESTALAAHRVYDANHRVIMLNRATPVVDRGYKTSEGIAGLQYQIAEDVLNVAAATGHERLDAIVQSEAAIFTTAAALRRPHLFRSLVIESGAGTLGEHVSAQEVAGRVVMDNVAGAFRYLHNPRQAVTSLRSLAHYIGQRGGDATWQEVESIADSDITDGALQKVRADGTKVAYIHAHADGAMKPEEVDKHIAMNMETGSADDNVDVVASIADKGARHGSLLFDEKGINAALSQVRQFEAAEQAAVSARHEVDLAR